MMRTSALLNNLMGGGNRGPPPSRPPPSYYERDRPSAPDDMFHQVNKRARVDPLLVNGPPPAMIGNTHNGPTHHRHPPDFQEPPYNHMGHFNPNWENGRDNFRISQPPIHMHDRQQHPDSRYQGGMVSMHQTSSGPAPLSRTAQLLAATNYPQPPPQPSIAPSYHGISGGGPTPLPPRPFHPEGGPVFRSPPSHQHPPPSAPAHMQRPFAPSGLNQPPGHHAKHTIQSQHTAPTATGTTSSAPPAKAQKKETMAAGDLYAMLMATGMLPSKDSSS